MYSFYENNYLRLIKITKSPYPPTSLKQFKKGLALIKITKSPYHEEEIYVYNNSLALIKITKSPYLSYPE